MIQNLQLWTLRLEFIYLAHGMVGCPFDRAGMLFPPGAPKIRTLTSNQR